MEDRAYYLRQSKITGEYKAFLKNDLLNSAESITGIA
jgi:hypothetical protein